VKQPVFLLDSAETSPDDLKQRAHAALAAFTQAVEAAHDEEAPGQHQQ